MKKINIDSLYENPKAFIAFFIGIFVAIFLATTIVLYATKKDELATEIAEEEPFIDTNHTPFPDSDSVYSVLLLGRGGEGHSGGTLTDTNILIRVDIQSKKVALISIPRDLWVSIPTDFNNETNHKFNEAYAVAVNNTIYANKRPEFRGVKGAGELTKYAAEVVTGIKANYYIDIDFNAFQNLIDDLGGVTIESKVAWDDYFYPVKGKENETCGMSASEFAEVHEKYSGFQLEKQFECRYEHIHFDQGKNNLDGDLALKYVRSRHSATYGGDFSRSEKQFALLKGVVEKLISKKVLTTGKRLIEGLFDLVSTDLTIKRAQELATIFGSPGDYEVVEINLTEENVLSASKSSAGAYILVPKEGKNIWADVQGFIVSKL